MKKLITVSNFVQLLWKLKYRKDIEQYEDLAIRFKLVKKYSDFISGHLEPWMFMPSVGFSPIFYPILDAYGSIEEFEIAVNKYAAKQKLCLFKDIEIDEKIFADNQPTWVIKNVKTRNVLGRFCSDSQIFKYTIEELLIARPDFSLTPNKVLLKKLGLKKIFNNE